MYSCEITLQTGRKSNFAAAEDGARKLQVLAPRLWISALERELLEEADEYVRCFGEGELLWMEQKLAYREILSMTRFLR